MSEIEDLEKKWNCKIDFPSTEQASDAITISGPEYQVPQAVDAFLGMVPESHEIAFQKSDDLEIYLTSLDYDLELRQKMRSQYEVDVLVNPSSGSLPKSATASVERLISASEGRLVLTYTRNNAGGLKDAIDFLITQLVPHGLDAKSVKGAIPRPKSDSFEDSLPFFDSKLLQKAPSLHSRSSSTRLSFTEADSTPASERSSLFDRLRKPGSISSIGSFMSRKNQNANANNSPGFFFKHASSNASKASLISMESRESGYRNIWNDSGVNLPPDEDGTATNPGGWPTRFTENKFPFGTSTTPGDMTPKHEPRASFDSGRPRTAHSLSGSFSGGLPGVGTIGRPPTNGSTSSTHLTSMKSTSATTNIATANKTTMTPTSTMPNNNNNLPSNANLPTQHGPMLPNMSFTSYTGVISPPNTYTTSSTPAPSIPAPNLPLR